MLERYGNIWTVLEQNNTAFGDSLKSHILVTLNNCVKHNGELVMGAGSALSAAQRFPNIPLMFGNKVKQLGYRYGVVFDPGMTVAGFQSKYHFRDKSTPELIQHSTKVLTEIANQYQDREFHLCYPGIGFGGLKMDDVAPIIQSLPDNVFVWMKSSKDKKEIQNVQTTQTQSV